ncbi:hypothetical protein [Nocardiopsis sp. HUAS JQ3]|uniref:hypothetical protein n=1 Tax=Nocardiopsis sp. HUAS JQ3 TaxID=3061629 RepID=UPI0023A9A1A2|nr:hypothetical protein [Nocardiopsis sp. HUAS JQ3]WDZ91133.1 hypothetical protein PV789_00725 [Nocardiopsis sp. HUAS JQ3]
MHAAPKDPTRYLPERKVGAAGAAGLAVTVLVYVAGLLGHPLPADVAAAAVGLAAFAVGYLVPSRRRGELDVEQGA